MEIKIDIVIGCETQTDVADVRNILLMATKRIDSELDNKQSANTFDKDYLRMIKQQVSDMKAVIDA